MAVTMPLNDGMAHGVAQHRSVTIYLLWTVAFGESAPRSLTAVHRPREVEGGHVPNLQLLSNTSRGTAEGGFCA